MIRRRLAAAAPALVLFLALAGCPIPQPLPSYPPGQPVTPPRIVVDDTVQMISPSETIVRIPAACAKAPVVPLTAVLRDVIPNDPVSARWFVNYDPTNQARSAIVFNSTVSVDATDTTLLHLDDFSFAPYDFPPVPGTGGDATPPAPGGVQVVELVVSNGFDPDFDKPPPQSTLPYRKPRGGNPPFEVQLFRWVFLTVPASPANCTGASCVPCP